MIPLAEPLLSETELHRVQTVLESGQLADGPEVRAFEREFADYCETAHAVATANGTAALHAALAALDIGPGDRVLTTPFSFIATANAIRLVGAEPVFADIDPVTYTLDPEAARQVAEREPIDAILAVHLYGLPAAMDPLAALADELEIPLIEDAAQAHGGTYEGNPAGSIGDVGCFSFYPTKNMTTGEGGMVTTDDEDIASRLEAFVNHGRTDVDDRSYVHERVGHNFRLTSLAATIGRTQLERLPGFLETRRENADMLTRGLRDHDVDVAVPVEPAHVEHAYHQYTIRARDRDHRDGLRDWLADHDIGVGVYYPRCIHQQPAYAGSVTTGDLSAAEAAAATVLSIPVHPGVTPTDCARITEVCAQYGA